MNHGYTKVAFFCLTIIVIVFALNSFKKTPETVSSLPLALHEKDLKNTVEKALSGARGTYAVAVKNFKTGEFYSVNENREFASGSLYKLWLMAEVYRQIQNNTLSEDETLSGDAAKLNDRFGIDFDTAELAEGNITLSVSDAIEQMITISHNYAAYLLTERISPPSLEEFLMRHNLNKSKLGDSPSTTASDITLYFEKLYRGQLANRENTQKMLDILKKQTLNDKLPKYLPPDVFLAHKTGEIDYFSHDAGIVFTPKGDYIIAVLSLSDYPPGAMERIAGISKAVYDYFDN